MQALCTSYLVRGTTYMCTYVRAKYFVHVCMHYKYVRGASTRFLYVVLVQYSVRPSKENYTVDAQHSHIHTCTPYLLCVHVYVHVRGTLYMCTYTCAVFYVHMYMYKQGTKYEVLKPGRWYYVHVYSNDHVHYYTSPQHTIINSTSAN